MNNTDKIIVIGAGLAGSEACFQLLSRGFAVDLYEMRPQVSTPIHHTALPAELVCSNSLGSNDPQGAPGVLKAEMRMLGSLLMEAADNVRVPAGQALAVDREKFSEYILNKLSAFPKLKIIREEITEIPKEGIVIIASGPLTTQPLAEKIMELVGSDYLYFYDAVSPVVLAETINLDIAFAANRYGRGTPDYLNCPMSKDEYDAFYDALISAERVDPKDFERGHFFEGCMPVEEMAERGKQTLLFGPLKPVGLDEKATAVVQLRKENSEGTMYSLVGFQTRLKWGEQKRVFRMMPGLENAEFVKYGVMHKNIFVDAPRTLLKSLQLKNHSRVFLAGQITGVEGYSESVAMGLVAALNAASVIEGKKLPDFPAETAIGSLLNHITDPEIKNFQPTNISFGVLPAANIRASKKDRKKHVAGRAIEAMKKWLEQNLEFTNFQNKTAIYNFIDSK